MATTQTSPATETTEGPQECARGQWCSAVTVHQQDDGTTVWLAAPTYRGLCAGCEVAAAGTLDQRSGLPAAWQLLRLWGLEPGRSGWAQQISPGAYRMPVAAGADMLMRAMVETLASWEERVRDVAGLSRTDTHRSRRVGLADPFRVVDGAARLLREWTAVLFALGPGPMLRDTGDGTVIVDLSGTDAGVEFLRMRYQARAILGFVGGRPEYFVGVPCKSCGSMPLARAPLPAGPRDEAMRSRCPACGHTMNDAQYAEWAKWYAGWAKSSGLACKRCQRRAHADCQWQACSCRVNGHSAAA